MKQASSAVCILWVALGLACSGAEPTEPSGAAGATADAGTEVEAGTDAIVADVQTDGEAQGDVLSPAMRPSVDGIFEEWSDDELVATDSAGDATGPYDLTEVWATGRGATVYLHAAVAATPVNLLAGPEGEAPLRIEVGLPDQRTLSVDLRAHTVTVDWTQAMRWSDVGFQIAPTTATTAIEIKLDLSALGVVQGDTIMLDFSGSDALSEPVPIGMIHDALEPERGDPRRADGAAFRVASLNVEWDGLTDPGRAEPLGRLLHAVAADIYCLQEVWETDADTIADRLGQIDPHGDGASWNVHRTGDTAIATREALTPWPHEASSPPYTGAGVELADGARVVVFTPRPTCCGYIGNASDAARIVEFQQLAAAIVSLREGTSPAGFEAFAEAPVLVMGDWNLVGSTTPLDLLTDPAGPSLDRWLLRHLVGDGATYTWRNDALGAFPPGTLDLLAHGSVDGATPLVPLAGFVLDSGELDAAMLEMLGIQLTDSLSTDHLLLVADFGM